MADFGQNAKKMKKKGADRFYNTEMHTTMGRRDLDPHEKARLKVIEMFEDLKEL